VPGKSNRLLHDFERFSTENERLHPSSNPSSYQFIITASSLEEATASTIASNKRQTYVTDSDLHTHLHIFCL
jgi:hypothetical protein